MRGCVRLVSDLLWPVRAIFVCATERLRDERRTESTGRMCWKGRGNGFSGKSARAMERVLKWLFLRSIEVKLVLKNNRRRLGARKSADIQAAAPHGRGP